MTLSNKVYNVTTNIKPPFVMYNGTTKQWSGLIVDYMETIASQLGIKYAFYTPLDREYGILNAKGKWSGMIGEIVNGNADIAFGGLTVSGIRATAVDFTEPFYESVGFSVLMKRQEVKTMMWGWLTSLEFSVWMCILGAYLVTTILVWIFDTWSPYAFRNCQHKYQDSEDCAKRFFTFKESLWYCFTALTPQGGGEAPKCFSARLTSATWWLFGFIIIASYTASMAAQLTLSRLEFSIETYAELIKQLRVVFGPVERSSAFYYYKKMAEVEALYYEVWRNMTLNNTLTSWERSKLAVWEYPVDEKYTKMFNHMKDYGLPSTIKEAVSKVRNSKSSTQFAWIAEYPDVLYYTMIHCDVKMLPDIISPRPYAIAVAKGSELKNHINRVLYNLSNTDYLDRLKKKWWDNNPMDKKCVIIDDRIPGLIIQNIGGLFMFIGMGIAVAYLTLIWEFAYHMYLRERLDKLWNYLDNKLHIIATLDKLGITKLKRPCQLASSDVKPIKPTEVGKSLEKF